MQIEPSASDSHDPRERQAKGVEEIISSLEREANDRVGKRITTEERWIEDLEAFHAKYPAKTREELKESTGSKAFINITRTKTEAMSARLGDLLFPTDDKNWGIKPTPRPRLTKSAKEAVRIARQMREEAEAALQAAQAEAGGQIAPEDIQATEELANEAETAAAELQEAINEAKNRAEMMEHTIDDQLRQSLYHGVMRDVIDDGCKIGTGVCKGPVTGERVRKGWKQKLDEEGNPTNVYELQHSDAGDAMGFYWVDPWSYFPDPDVRRAQDSLRDYERHLWSAEQLKSAARRPGFRRGAIKYLLQNKPSGDNRPDYLSKLRNIGAEQQDVGNNIYVVWEFSGALDVEEIRKLHEALQEEDPELWKTVEDEMRRVSESEGEDGETVVDELAQLKAVIWFCQGQLLKFDLYPFDSLEPLYSVFNLKKDEASIYGYGIPSIIRDAQKSLNSAWRAMLDNAGFSAGPQLFVRPDLVDPADDVWEITPLKLWLGKQGVAQDDLPIKAINIDTNQEQLANIVALSSQFADQITSMPQIAQGEQGDGVTKTAHGMSLLMNSANVVFRRIVKDFDDDVTVPNIRRAYDWNMQHTDDDSIKGDFEVDARGSSVLLTKEMQAQNLMFIASNFGGHPVYGPMLKNRNLLKVLFQSMMIPSDEILLTEEEIEAIVNQASAENEAAAAAQALENAKIELEREKIAFQREKLAADVAMANLNARVQLQIKGLDYEKGMQIQADKHNIEIDKISRNEDIAREDRESKERIFAAEAAITQNIGPGGGGHF